MNRNRMLLVGVIALILSLPLAYLVYIQGKTPKIPTTPKVVAKTHLLPGMLLSAENTAVMQFPIYQSAAKSYEDPKKLEKRVAQVEMFANDIITEEKLVEEGAIGGLTAVIETDKRAISVKVDSVIGVAGFVLPGTYVDVIATGQPANSEDLVSKVIVENVKVLTADKILERDPKGEAKDSKVVTLLVDPDQANKIALASTDGRIQLALRNSQDVKIEAPPPITKKQLYAQDQAPRIKEKAKDIGKGNGKGPAVKLPPPSPRRRQPIDVEERLGATQKVHKVEVETTVAIEQP
jgi:pilus assembly protein CpaB